MTSLTTSEGAVEELKLLRERASGFGLLTGNFLLLLWVYRALNDDLGEGGARGLVGAESILHLSIISLLFGMWAFIRRRGGSARFVRGLESTAIVIVSALMCLLGTFFHPIYSRPDLLILSVMTFVACARAVYIPSTGLWTGVLGGIMGSLILFTVGFIYANVDVAGELATNPRWARVMGPDLLGQRVVTTLLWWTLSTGLAAATSRVIYGLRRETRAIRSLGHYQVERKIGEGGMGVVYQAHHSMLRRPTAIKLLPPGKSGEEDMLRFEREAMLTARLRHPNTVTIYDYGRTPDGIFYYAMELLEGVNLKEVVDVSGPLPPARVGHILDRVAGALAEAHSVGLIHRDIKPANIMICNQGGEADVPKVLDFGLVKDLARQEAPHSDGGELTQRSELVGTPLYMAPELISDPSAVGPQSDLYALGAVGYFLLTGEHVFLGSTAVEICAHHLHEIPERPSIRLGRELPQALENLILQCLEKSPDARPASAACFLESLDKCELAIWSMAAANEWWAKCAKETTTRQSGVPVGDQTLRVDFERRAKHWQFSLE